MNAQSTAKRAPLIDANYAWIFVSPRATIRKIVECNPRDKVITLVAVAGIVGVVAYAVQFRSPSAFTIGTRAIPMIEPATLRKIYLAAVISAPILAIAFLYVRGAILRWSGELFGGTSSAVNVRAALGWASVPLILSSLILIALAFVLPPAPVSANDRDFLLTALKTNWPALSLGAVLSFYAFIVTVNCIAEVHRFSAWRAVGAIAIELLLMLGGAIVALTALADIVVLVRG